MLKIAEIEIPVCKGCDTEHFDDEPCDQEAIQKKLDKAYWSGVLDGGMDSATFEAALIKGENGELD